MSPHRPAPAGTTAEELALTPADRHAAILRAIAGARHQLLLSVFRCDDDDVVEALEQALGRGVQVRVLTTRRVKGSSKKLKKFRKRLEARGAQVTRYDDPVVKYHAKYLVADDGPAVIATLNLTRKCFRDTFDGVLTTRDAAVVDGLQRLFAADSQTPHAPTPPELSRRLVLGPENAREQIVSLLTQARRRIRIVDHKLDDPSIIALLRARQREGVDVQLLGKGQLGALKAHGRAIIVDGEAAVLGSIALRAIHLEFRREVGIVIEDRSIVAELDGVFENALRAQPAGSTSLQQPETSA